MVDSRIKISNHVYDFYLTNHISKMEFEEILSTVATVFDNNFLYMNVYLEDKIVIDLSVEMSDYEAFMIREKCLSVLEKNFKCMEHFDLRFCVYGD